MWVRATRRRAKVPSLTDRCQEIDRKTDPQIKTREFPKDLIRIPLRLARNMGRYAERHFQSIHSSIPKVLRPIVRIRLWMKNSTVILLDDRKRQEKPLLYRRRHMIRR